VLGRLEQRGLITRVTDAGDTRAKTVAVTRRGAALAVRAVRVVEEADARFFAEHAPHLPAALRATGP
jgi:DNA-binding MarR family transcriptional regulator